MKTHINFIKIQLVVATISVAVVLVGLWSIFGPAKFNIGPLTAKNFNLGIDFQGGVSQVVTIYSGMNIEEVRSLSAQAGLGDTIQEIVISEKDRIGNATSFIIKTIINKDEQKQIIETQKTRAEYTSAKFLQDKTDALFNLVASKYGKEFVLEGDAFAKAKKYKESGNIFSGEIEEQESKIILENIVRESANTISPASSEKMKSDSIFLILFVLFIMLVYISWRFKFAYAMGAIVALIHDTVIMLGVISLTGTELDLTVVAAILTIIGYSINDTIVVFDRIRENYTLMKESRPEDIFNISINQTLNRTIITSLTTILSVVALFLWGGPKIHAFSFTLLVGLFVGTYSSIFIASPIVLYADKLIGKNKLKYKKLEEKALKEEQKALENNGVEEDVAEEDDGVVSKKTLLRLQSKKKK
ncbi:MAG: protein-export membrane protein SecF [Spirochaetes bacterium RIFOXYB1_FULL_32_8]|nr:MAG: protein-export membrane protein SecF [Spirochaetes bacterium GWE1_32_154]OHD50350.1 MAG: protein-export membrane protein SecF [Spirochaetes bacterium GWE2_31_10]OHD79981.1 MAG: protein-export membrane protein SecF [Spirochaetes bacterium RIFOXYB1_FULL_32_8]HBD93863.1 protein translocase subunit SecF [Spirochaetia bacterium]HBI38830.1 protein translocase subunit SecF [Spirochaetia bacterium]